MRDDFDYLGMASSYANIEHLRLKRYISRYEKVSSGYGEEGFFLASIIIAFVKMIANFCKYILMTIKYLLVDAGIITGILKGVMSLFGEAGPVKKILNIKVSDPDDIKMKISNLSRIVNRRLDRIKETNHFFKKEDMLEKLYSVIDPEIVEDKRYFTIDFSIDYSNNDRDAKRALSNMKYRFKTFYDKENVNKIKVNRFVTIKDAVDVKDVCRDYKDLMVDMYENVYKPYQEYMNVLNDKFDKILRKSQELEKKPDTATTEDELFMFYLDGILPLLVKDVKNTTERYTWLKNEIVSGLVKISDNI